MVCTEPYYKQVMRPETPGVDHGAMWEGTSLLHDFYVSGSDSNKYIPILLGGGDPSNIPDQLRGKVYYRLPSSYEDLYRLLTNQPYTPKPQLRTLKELPSKERKSFLSDAGPRASHHRLSTKITVLRLCFEAAVRNGSNGMALQTGEMDQSAATEGISAAEIQDSLDILVQRRFIEARYGTNHPFFAKMTPLGFREYAEHFIPDIETIRRATAIQILADVRDSNAVAEAIQQPVWMVEWVFRLLQLEGHVQVNGPLQGPLNVALPLRVSLRAVYGDG
jgi:hypothetical protein